MVAINTSKSPKSPSSKGHWLRRNALLTLTIGAVFMGVILGCTGRTAEPDVGTIRLISFPGELLMRMLKCIIIPLIASSLITGLAQLDVRQSGRLGGLAVLYYLTTTAMAVTVGFANIFKNS